MQILLKIQNESGVKHPAMIKWPYKRKTTVQILLHLIITILPKLIFRKYHISSIHIF